MTRIFKTVWALASAICFLGVISCSGNVEPENGSGNDDDNAGQTGTDQNVKYRERLLVTEFTSVGCQNCPSMASLLHSMQKETPDRFSIAAFHTHFSGMADPMYIDKADTYIEKFNIGGLPAAVVSFRSGDLTVNDVKSKMAEEEKSLPECGVAVSSSFDASSRKAKVTVRITSNKALQYRYLVLLVEDGIKAPQAGTDNDEYEHKDVVRALVGTNIYGERLNKGEALVQGLEYTAERTATLGQGWKAENMKVIVAAMLSNDNGVTWYCENSNECKLGESADYLISK